MARSPYSITSIHRENKGALAQIDVPACIDSHIAAVNRTDAGRNHVKIPGYIHIYRSPAGIRRARYPFQSNVIGGAKPIIAKPGRNDSIRIAQAYRTGVDVERARPANLQTHWNSRGIIIVLAFGIEILNGGFPGGGIWAKSISLGLQKTTGGDWISQRVGDQYGESVLLQRIFGGRGHCPLEA